LARIPINVVGVSAEWFRGTAEDAQHDGGGGSEMGQPFREAGPARPVAIFVPPAIFHKEDAVLDLPVIAHRCQQLTRRNGPRVDAGYEVARIGEPHGAIVSDDIAVHA